MLRFSLLLAAFLIIQTSASAQEKPVLSLKTIVIDAGHGGNDPGTVWDGIREKDINLDVAIRLGNLIKKNHPDVQVIYTREKDVYIPLSERSALANKNKADLFVSIHVNSVKGAASARGTETFLMGTDKSGKNMDVCKRENSVILLEENYSTKYAGYDPNSPDSFIFFNLMQNAQFEQSVLMASYVEEQMALGPVAHSRGIKQAPLLVLWQTTMPAVLIEIGFLSNDTDREKLKDRKNRGEIAGCIYEAFKRFKEQYEIGGDSSVNVAALMPQDTTPVKAAEPVKDAKKAKSASSTKKQETKVIVGKPHWRIQIMAASKQLKEDSALFKGITCDCIEVNGLYKYFTGIFASRHEAVAELASIKEKFPGSFIVEFGADDRPLK